MRRKAMDSLVEWKDEVNRKPLIIRGARQVGKTWLMKEFGKLYYEQCVYIMMDENERMQDVFKDTFDIQRIIMALQIECGFTIEPDKTLIILDEIQEIPRALKSLKYFYENAPEYHIVAAGSLLGVTLHEGTSFPVGKVAFLDMYPLDYEEFLNALGENQSLQLLVSRDFSLITSFRGKFIDLLKQYYYVGGMPEAVLSFTQHKDFKKVRIIQRRLLNAYEEDFSKHAPTEIVTRIKMLWNSIPTQLAKENKKFVYGVVREGARAREYEVALTWLMDSGLIYKLNRVKKPDFPLNAYQDFSAFKLYVLDVGLLGAMSKLNVKILLEGNRMFEEYKGALTEQFVLQQLMGNEESDIFYWTSEQVTAEIDFILQFEDKIIPIEVKAEENLRAKSLRSYCKKYSPMVAIRTSMSDYRREDWMINYPLYCISTLEDYLSEI